MAKRTLTDKIFTDADAAREHLESIHWPDGPYCPRCGVMGDRITKLQGKSTRPGVYKCKDCRKPFTVTVGTVMERSKIPLNLWVLAAHLMSASKKGISAHQLHRMLGTNYETAWFLAHRLREAMHDTKAGPLGGEGKTIEADETFVGGRDKNRHKHKRGKHVGGPWGRQVVFTLIERGGAAHSTHVPTISAKNLRPVMVKMASRKSRLMTDEGGQYLHVGKEYASHGTVTHSADEYVRGDIHVNTAENYFSLLKRGITGVYHAVSEQHLQRYLFEFDFRYSRRTMTDAERADELLAGAKGKRLYYQQPSEAKDA